jgi:hypothetical protein
MTQESDTYFLEIEAHFAMRRNTPFILSAKDWVLMKKWRDDGVPLPVVIEAIDSVFEKNEASGRRKIINSLSYCRHAVKELWQDRKELQVGEGEVTPEEAPAAVLERLIADVAASGAPADTIASVVDELRAIGAERSVPKIEERLIEIERQMVERIVAAGSDFRSELGDLSALDEKTRKRTEEANLRRIVREKFGLPRLTLFR